MRYFLQDFAAALAAGSCVAAITIWGSHLTLLAN